MDRVGELVLLDLGRGMLARARRRAEALGLSVDLREASAEQLPFEDESFDTVVFTWSLCTIPDPMRALGEARRVLSPMGGSWPWSTSGPGSQAWPGGSGGSTRSGT